MWDWRWIPIHLISPRISGPHNSITQTSTIYHLLSKTLVSYHALLTTWSSKFDRTPIRTRYLRRIDTQQISGLASLDKDAEQSNSEKTQGKKKGKEGQDGSQTIVQAGGGRQRGYLYLSPSFKSRQVSRLRIGTNP